MDAILKNISLREFTTFKIGGPARYFVRVKNIEDLKKSVNFARENKLEIFVLGAGSNLLVSDGGFLGLVLKMEISGMEISGNIFEIGAGVLWDDFVAFAVGKKFYGAENLSLIPGTVGGSVVQNIGAYGAEVKNIVDWVDALNIETGEIKRFSKEECCFDYRSSFFKAPEGKKFIILKVAFKLSKDASISADYKDIKEYVSERGMSISDITLEEIRKIIIDIRTKKLPDLSEIGTAGSFFKNPIVSKEKFSELVSKFSDIVSYPSDSDFVKISAAWILDKVCGFKGYREGDAGVYKNQALVLINFGSASFEDIKSLAEKMVSCVKEKTGVNLEREVEYVS